MENQPEVNPSQPITNPLSEPEKKTTRVPLIALIAFIVILLTGVLVLAYWSRIRSNQQLTFSETDTESSPHPTLIPTTLSSSPTPPPINEGIFWKNEPQAIASLTLFKPNPNPNEAFFIPKDAKYYLVGTKTDGTEIINAYIPINGPGENQFFRLFRSTTGQISVIIPPGNDFDWLKESLTAELQSDIKIINQSFTELTPPDPLVINQSTYLQAYSSGQPFSAVITPEKITDTPFGSFYRLDNFLEDTPSITARKLFLRLKDNTIIPYTLKSSLLNDDQTPNATWTNPTYNQSYTQSFLGGCSENLFSTVPIIKDASSLTAKVQVGEDKFGRPIYTLTDSQSTLVTDLYGLYKIGRDYEGSTQTILDLTSFSASPTHILWQDELGDWQIFVNQNNVPMAECAKPVIYLYPETTTSIHVQVGAQVRLSDPPYPETGWQVMVQPNGKISYQGNTYSSLFWEGLGEGYYPDYRDYGTVVSQHQLLSTLQSHLTQLGLTSQESTDFMTFWQPKLPTTPYVRLTWLGTTDMDRLAPLKVDPKPDTRIRLFLEFEGLESPRNLKPQTLSAPQRRGFTLVEWGGLLLRPRP